MDINNGWLLSTPLPKMGEQTERLYGNQFFISATRKRKWAKEKEKSSVGTVCSHLLQQQKKDHLKISSK